MKSPAASIIWELCARQRWAVVLVLAAIPLCVLLNAVGFPRTFSFVIQFIMLLLAAATIFWIFTFGETDVRLGKQSGFPPHLYVLPIGTARMVSIRIVCGVLVLLSFYVACWLFVISAWGLHLPPSWLAAHLSALAGMIVGAQAVIWSLYAFPWIRFLVLAAVVVGIGFLGIVVPSEEFRAMSPRTLAALLGSFTIAGWFMAVLGVARDRRGGWVGWTGRLVQALSDAMPARQHGFPSVGSALFWFERHHKLLFSALLFTFMVGSNIVFLPLGSALDSNRQAWLLVAPMLSLIAASVIGQSLTKSEPWSTACGLPLFSAIRPVTTGTLLVAKLRTITLLTIVCITLSAVISPFAFSAIYLLSDTGFDLPSWSEFRRQHQVVLGLFAQPVMILFLVAAIWQSMAAGLSVGLIGNSRKIMVRNFIAMLVGATIGGVALWMVDHPEKRPTMLPILLWVAGVIVLTKVARASLSFRSVIKRRLLSRQQFVLLIFLWLLLATLILLAYATVISARLLPVSVILFVAAYLWPGSELPNCAIHLAKDRHR